MLSSNMLLLNLILLIEVTFSTPTPDYVKNQLPREMANVSGTATAGMFDFRHQG